MRLWHEQLIPLISGQRLVDLHRTCCALRGNGGGKKNRLIDFIWKYGPAYLARYHHLVLKEMDHRMYHYDVAWQQISFHGHKSLPWYDPGLIQKYNEATSYPEMDLAYMGRDIDDLRRKGDEGVIDAADNPCHECGQILVKTVDYCGFRICEECIIRMQYQGGDSPEDMQRRYEYDQEMREDVFGKRG
jgi:uncharacterized protein (TIGR02328 family)